MSYFERSIDLHQQYKGKIEMTAKCTVETLDDLAILYSPGVAAPCLEIEKNPSRVYDLTIKGNTVAIISDGSAVLGLGNIGPEAAIPVMEGKALLFKTLAGIDAFPICLATQDTEEIIATIKNIAPVFGGINLEDIAAPRCFEIEDRLQDLGIPVFHDDQHGTAIIVTAALINASKIVNKPVHEMKVVINGAGAAGIAIAKMLVGFGLEDKSAFPGVKDLVMCDTVGIIHKGRTDLNSMKVSTLAYTNMSDAQGSLKDALVGCDVFIGVSKGNLLTADDIRTMNTDSIVFGLANPIPEIMPEEAYKGGAKVVGTGRSDLPNQINNVLGFPGIFKGALQSRAKRITNKMKFAAAFAIASMIKEPNFEYIVPSALDKSVVDEVAKAVRTEAEKTA
jgi:malate dehydrogenase (oxaloacetate-decarboxylating)